jgi:hypothetical protein
MITAAAIEGNVGRIGGEKMYEVFTDRARKVVQLANQEAQRLNHEYIGTEHMLLGLLKEGSGVAITVLMDLGMDLQKIVAQVEALIQSRPDLTTTQTPRAKKVIEYAMEEARNLKHAYVGTEHILLGLMREQDGVAAKVLKSLGLTLDGARAQITLLLGQDRKEFREGRSLSLSGIWPEEVGNEPEPLPARCPKCGAGRVVRVLWGGTRNHRPVERRDIEAGNAMFASLSASPFGESGPSWVCIQCSPGWVEVDDLVLQDYQLQFAKTEAIRNHDFSTAAKHRDAQDHVRRRWWAVVQELLKNQ